MFIEDKKRIILHTYAKVFSLDPGRYKFLRQQLSTLPDNMMNIIHTDPPLTTRKIEQSLLTHNGTTHPYSRLNRVGPMLSSLDSLLQEIQPLDKDTQTSHIQGLCSRMQEISQDPASPSDFHFPEK